MAMTISWDSQRPTRPVKLTSITFSLPVLNLAQPVLSRPSLTFWGCLTPALRVTCASAALIMAGKPLLDGGHNPWLAAGRWADTGARQHKLLHALPLPGRSHIPICSFPVSQVGNKLSWSQTVKLIIFEWVECHTSRIHAIHISFSAINMQPRTDLRNQLWVFFGKAWRNSRGTSAKCFLAFFSNEETF